MSGLSMSTPVSAVPFPRTNDLGEDRNFNELMPSDAQAPAPAQNFLPPAAIYKAMATAGGAKVSHTFPCSYS